jgi:heme exporter protein B
MKLWLRAVGAVLQKDLRLERRSREALTSMAFFSLLVMVLFGFSFDAGGIDRSIMAETLGPGLLWIAFSFSGVLGLNRSFAVEREGGCLQALMLAPVDRSAVFAGKMLGNLILIGLVEIVTIPVFSILMRVSVLPCLPRLALIAFLGTIGFTAVGTLLSALSSGSRLREVLLPLLLYPIWVPVLIAATQLTGQALGGRPAAEGERWFALIAAYDLVFVTAGLMLFDRLLEE